MKILLICLMFSFISCKELMGERKKLDFDNGQNQNTQPELTTEVTFEDIKQKIILKYDCLKCHSWADSETELIKRVDSGSPERSDLYIRLDSGNMPLGGPRVDSKDLQVLESYILQMIN